MNHDSPTFSLLALTIDLHLHAPQSLKEKRGIVKRIIQQLRKEFLCAISETGAHDSWQRAQISLALIGSDSATLDRVSKSIEDWLATLHNADVIEIRHFAL